LVTVRAAALSDAERLTEIYDYYVRNTAITFEYETPTPEEFRERMRKTMERFPYLVIEVDGLVMGYAYGGAFHSRAAYSWCAEGSIYLDCNARKCGLGRRLYEELETSLKKMGICNFYACIGYPEQADEYLTANSAEFHAHLGFEKIGEFHRCGYKFGRWYNMIWMEKLIGSHSHPQAPVVPYPELD